MSGLGGFCPLPIRLGGSATDGLVAEQHARAAADMAAAVQSTTFARITFTKSGSTFTTHGYTGVNGKGIAHAPTLASLGTGITRITFAAVYEDAYEEPYVVSIRHARATPHGTALIDATVVVQAGRNIVDVYTFNSAGAAVDAKVSVAVSGWNRPVRIGDYDGATDKTNTTTETVPYAWAWYNDYTAALGTAFTTASSGLMHAQKLALARNEAGVQRAAEKIPNNARPNTADDMLGEWVQILRVRLRGNESRQEVRQRCAARFESTRGNSRSTVDAVLQRLLGDYFVKVWRNEGASLSVPPTPTHWPTINPGPASYSLGGGAWLSSRAHLVVEVLKPHDLRDQDFAHLTQVELYDELDRLLPAWATFNWATGVGDGFHLDIDELDFNGLTPS